MTVDTRSNGTASAPSTFDLVAKKIKPWKVPVTFRAKKAWKLSRPWLLTVAGLGCLDYAAFEWNTIAGFVATGLSFLLLEQKGKS